MNRLITICPTGTTVTATASPILLRTSIDGGRLNIYLELIATQSSATIRNRWKLSCSDKSTNPRRRVGFNLCETESLTDQSVITADYRAHLFTPSQTTGTSVKADRQRAFDGLSIPDQYAIREPAVMGFDFRAVAERQRTSIRPEKGQGKGRPVIPVLVQIQPALFYFLPGHSRMT